MTPISELLGSGRIEGEALVTGSVTAAVLRTTAAGHDWAVITLDDGGGTIDVHVSPRVWRDAACPVRLGACLTVSGRLDAGPPEGLTILAADVTPGDGVGVGMSNSQSATTSSQIRSKAGCPDPIECDHEAALGQAEARVAAVRALHSRDDSNPLGPWCDICLCKWPCRTAVALGAPSDGVS